MKSHGLDRASTISKYKFNSFKELVTSFQKKMDELEVRLTENINQQSLSGPQVSLKIESAQTTIQQMKRESVIQNKKQ